MPDSGNQGISGQSINITAQNVAVGSNSRIEQTVSSGQFRGPLADLQRAIEGFDGPPATRDALMAGQAEIAAELEMPAPDKNGLLAKLASLKELAGPAATVVQAVAALAQVVAAIC